MLSKEEVNKLLDCSQCQLNECIGCDITWTDRKNIREYIQALEEKLDNSIHRDEIEEKIEEKIEEYANRRDKAPIASIEYDIYVSIIEVLQELLES